MSYDDEAPQNPFTRPGFITATVVVAIILILGILVVVRTAGSNDPAAAPTGGADPGASVTPDPSEAAAEPSVCGLDGEVLSGSLTSAPDAKWEYQGTVAYPTSTTYGPGETTADGVRYCFQHSPAGALFMAANAITQGSDPAVSAAWADQVLAEGPFRDQLLTDVGAGSSEGTRLRLAGFRILSYDGETARVDLGVVGSSSGQAVTLSGVYELVWQGGDWKISTDVQAPLDMATIPDLAGYITWGE